MGSKKSRNASVKAKGKTSISTKANAKKKNGAPTGEKSIPKTPNKQDVDEKV